MANRRNAVKKIRADERKRVQNRSTRSELRTITKKFLTLCVEKQYDKAKDYCRELFSKLDKAVKKGIVKENTANRSKSRVSRRLHLVKA